MTTLQMNEQLLSTICLVQSAKQLFINETDLVKYRASLDNPACMAKVSSPSDWLGRTRNYYFSLDSAYIANLGLAKNEYCFLAILQYKVTGTMLNTQFEDLAKFTFSF